jgi:hypothetical protein
MAASKRTVQRILKLLELYIPNTRERGHFLRELTLIDGNKSFKNTVILLFEEFLKS